MNFRIDTFGGYYDSAGTVWYDDLKIEQFYFDTPESLITTTDYYPGGFPMPGRNIVGDYRYNYQGQELDPETGKVAFQLRLYDPRINRWLTTDPYGQYHSPYVGMGNDWVNGIDPDGGYDSKWDRFWAWVGGGFQGKMNINNPDAADPMRRYGISKPLEGEAGFSFDFGFKALANDIVDTQNFANDLRNMGMDVSITDNQREALNSNINLMVGLALPTGKIVTTSKVATRKMSVIGPRASYREFAKKTGANFLNVTDDAWTMRKNVKFLQGVVKRGDDVIFSGKYDPLRLNSKSVLAQEIRYLQRHGYSWNKNFTRLIKQ